MTHILSEQHQQHLSGRSSDVEKETDDSAFFSCLSQQLGNADYASLHVADWLEYAEPEEN